PPAQFRLYFVFFQTFERCQNQLGSPVVNLLGQTGYCARLKQSAQREVDLEALPHPRHELRADQRVAAELEEVVEDADLIDAQKLAPKLRHFGFGLVARRYIIAPELRPDMHGSAALRSPLFGAIKPQIQARVEIARRNHH